jgi:UDP-2,4-diacetamido-2,4,6-trideoxy-beta-L-altropyranose hydrolase
MKICIRADGGSFIGMGHIMRTLVIAQELRRRGFYVFYACKSDAPLSNKYRSGIDKIKEEDFDIVFLREENVIEDLIAISADCIITDSYDVNEEYFRVVHKYFKTSGCIDDENRYSYFDVDFLINQNPYANSLIYEVNKNTKLMLGTQYVILRNEFRNLPNKIINGKIENIMITVGGSDNSNLTERIIKKLNDFAAYKLHIVIGKGFNNIEEIRKYECENIILYFDPQMSELMLTCDVAISSCGTTLYELFVCGTPTIGIITADNQELTAKTLDENGIIKYAEIDNVDRKLLGLTKSRRENMYNQGKKIVDGLGYKRVIDTICSLV